jgi:hypothetical protein
MSTNSKFFRLYRELDRSLPSKKINDHDYEKERKEILQNLNEYRDILKEPPPITGPKYHGKLVRKLDSGFDNERRKHHERKKKEYVQRRNLREVINQSQDLKEVIHELHNIAQNKEKIPILLRKKMDIMEQQEIGFSSPAIPLSKSPGKLKDRPISLEEEFENLRSRPKSSNLRIPKHVPSSSSKKSLSQTMPGDEDKQNEMTDSQYEEVSISTFNLPRIKTHSSMLSEPHQNYRQRRMFDRSYTKSKWSEAERQKFYLIYQEMILPPPECKHIQMWISYFHEFSERFIIFFPERSKVETIEKIHEMILKKQMKEKGEKEFWIELQEAKDRLRRELITQEYSKSIRNLPNDLVEESYFSGNHILKKDSFQSK